LLSQKLDQALGSNSAAIHWDLARTTLQAASGIPTLVGLAADPDTAAPPAAQASAAPASARKEESSAAHGPAEGPRARTPGRPARPAGSGMRRAPRRAQQRG